MRASPACQVTLTRFGVWRGAVCGLALASTLCVASWFASRDQPVPVSAIAFTAFAGFAGIALLVSLLRMPQAALRWDGQCWHLADAPGELALVVDLGPWMLLRFVASGTTRVTWLPTQCRGLEAQWHALRCAVYSPRPAPEL